MQTLKVPVTEDASDITQTVYQLKIGWGLLVAACYDKKVCIFDMQVFVFDENSVDSEQIDR